MIPKRSALCCCFRATQQPTKEQEKPTDTKGTHHEGVEEKAPQTQDRPGTHHEKEDEKTPQTQNMAGTHDEKEDEQMPQTQNTAGTQYEKEDEKMLQTQDVPGTHHENEEEMPQTQDVPGAHHENEEEKTSQTQSTKGAHHENEEEKPQIHDTKDDVAIGAETTTQPTHSRNTKCPGLKVTLKVKEYLWRFIEKYHTNDVRRICGRHAKCEFSRAAIHCQVEITSTDGHCIESVSKRLAELCKNLSAQIVDEIISVPPHVSPDAVRLLLEQAPKSQLVYFIDASNNHHIAGAAKEAKRAKKYIEGLPTDVRPQPTRSKPFTVDTPNVGIRIEIYCGNLVDEQVDALVNPANKLLSHGDGAAKAIADAAGSKLAEECNEYVERHGRLKVGEVMHTSAGDMQPRIKYVIHALGPRVEQFRNQKLFDAVSETFENCLLYANSKLKIESVSIPAISSGIFGVPLQLVADAAFDATIKFDNMFVGAKDRSLRKIGYVNFDARTTVAFIKSFSRLEQRSASRSPSGDPSDDSPTEYKEFTSPDGSEIEQPAADYPDGDDIEQPADYDTSVSGDSDAASDNAQIVTRSSSSKSESYQPPEDEHG